jgi:NitT/TauT family transport system substrate-binding protein
MSIVHTRRRFLTTLSAAGATGLVSAPPLLAADAALETTTVRIVKAPAICLAPQVAGEELLRAEGFTDIRYVDVPPTYPAPLAVGRGEADFSAGEATYLIQAIDRGAPVVAVGGVHVGCYELFAQ